MESDGSSDLMDVINSTGVGLSYYRYFPDGHGLCSENLANLI